MCLYIELGSVTSIIRHTPSAPDIQTQVHKTSRREAPTNLSASEINRFVLSEP